MRQVSEIKQIHTKFSGIRKQFTALRLYFVWGALVILGVLFLKAPAVAAMGVSEGLSLCVSSVIPALFPFMVIAGIASASGLCRSAGKMVSAPLSRLLGISPPTSAAFLVGLISGFPVGAVSVISLYQSRQIERSEAEFALGLCNNTGPAFLCGYLGARLWGDARLGFLFWAAEALAALACGTLCKRLWLGKNRFQAVSASSGAFRFGEIARVISGSAQNLLTVCGFVVFFTVLQTTLRTCFGFAAEAVPPALRGLFSGFLEVTSGLAASVGDLSLPFLAVSAFLVGWAGLCVHLQVMYFAAEAGLRMRRYFAQKLLCGLLTALFVVLAVLLFR